MDGSIGKTAPHVRWLVEGASSAAVQAGLRDAVMVARLWFRIWARSALLTASSDVMLARSVAHRFFEDFYVPTARIVEDTVSALLAQRTLIIQAAAWTSAVRKWSVDRTLFASRLEEFSWRLRRETGNRVIVSRMTPRSQAFVDMSSAVARTFASAHAMALVPGACWSHLLLLLLLLCMMRRKPPFRV